MFPGFAHKRQRCCQEARGQLAPHWPLTSAVPLSACVCAWRAQVSPPLPHPWPEPLLVVRHCAASLPGSACSAVPAPTGRPSLQCDWQRSGPTGASGPPVAAGRQSLGSGAGPDAPRLCGVGDAGWRQSPVQAQAWVTAAPNNCRVPGSLPLRDRPGQRGHSRAARVITH